MSKAWPMVALGEVAERIERLETPTPGVSYRQIGVKLWGEGAYERETIDGSQTKYATLNRCEAGDIIVNKIWARNGSVAVVPDSLSGTYGSGEFPTFRPRPDALLPRWFHWFSRTPSCAEQCDVKSRGTSGKNRIRPEKFLEIEIPLPPLAEQRRIVARIEELAGKIEEARGLRAESRAKREFLNRNVGRHVFDPDRWPRIALEQVCSSIVDCLHSNPICTEDGDFPTIRSPDVGWGTIDLKHAYKTDEQEYLRRTRRGELETGDMVLVREGGGTGKAGLVENGRKFSLGQRVMMVRADSDRIDPRFLLHQWLSPLVYQEQILDRMKGSASPHMNIKAMRKFSLVLPPIGEQRKIVAYLDTLSAAGDSLRQLQAATITELEATLPSILDKALLGEL